MKRSDYLLKKKQVACTDLIRLGEVTKERPEGWSAGFPAEKSQIRTFN